MKIEVTGFVGDTKTLPNGDTVFTVNTSNGKNKETGKYNNFYVDCRIRAGEAINAPPKDSRATVKGGFIIRQYQGKDGSNKIGGNIFVDSVDVTHEPRTTTSPNRGAPGLKSYDIPEGW